MKVAQNSSREKVSFKSSNSASGALVKFYGDLIVKSSWRNRLARSTVNREVVGSIPTEDDHFIFQMKIFLCLVKNALEPNSCCCWLNSATEKLTFYRE